MPAASSSSMDLIVTKFILTFKGEVESTYSLAVRTVELVKSLVECDTWNNADQLIKNIKCVHQKLEEELPQCQYNVAHNIIK